ncbi:MAG: murein biosynthesis integral membrane protein MurJ [Chlamydiae bacterium]|nr:murein biosynthesis integral membrane protein MurJ [Chlamydiota bacterium]
MEDTKQISKNSTEQCDSISRFAFLFSIGTFLSRISGMLREVATAFVFGTSPLIAAFMIAYRLALVMRRLLGEGALLVGFIPHYEAIRTQSPVKAAQFFRDVHVGLSLFLILLLIVVEALLYGLLQWVDFSEDNRQIIYLSMLIFPGLLFICLSALAGALLQCHKKFFLSGVSPAVFNFAWIAAVWGIKEFHLSFAWLAGGTVFAFFLQWALFIPSTVRFFKEFLPYKEWFSFKFITPELKQMLTAISLSVIGLGATQISSFLSAIFARASSLEGPAYLHYAMRLQQMPIALIGVALSSALLPTLSRSWKTNDSTGFIKYLQFGLTRAFSFIMPCTLAILVLGISSVNIIYCHGDFTPLSTINTTKCLWAFGAGLIPMVFTLLLSQAFFSQKDYLTPTIAAILSVAVSIALNVILVFLFEAGPESVALATSFSSALNLWYLLRKLNKKIGTVFSLPILISFCKVTLCAILASAIVLVFGYVVFQDPTLPILLGKASYGSLPTKFFPQLIHFSAMASCFFASFILFAILFKAKEVLEILKMRKVSIPLDR